MSKQVNGKFGGCLGRILKIGVGLFIALLFVVVIGRLYEVRMEKEVAVQYPAPGQMVEVNGRQMHIDCRGEGSPTIILDAGQGGWSTDWTDMMPQLTQENRVCAYDRAGYGWSEAAADERTPQDAANDLAALLAAAAIEPPYLYVGFSHAGLVGRIYAAQHADDLMGMVLIDPATEFDNEILGPELLRQQQAAVGIFEGFTLLAKLGIVRGIGPAEMAGSMPFIPAEVASPDLYYTFIAHPQWWETSTQEFISRMDEDNLNMVRTQGQIQDIPLTIIGAEQFGEVGEINLAEVDAARKVVLTQLAGQSAQGEFIVAADSSHNVLQDRPTVIVDAILEMVAGASR